MLSDRYATKREAARLLGVNLVTIWRWAKDGKIRGEKLGQELLIPRKELARLVKARRASRG